MEDPVFLTQLAGALLLAGVLAGFLAGLLGVGGGIVVVPVLFHILSRFGFDEGLSMHVAVGTSLATIIPTAIASTRAHHRRQAVDFTLLKSWGPGIFGGVIVGILIAGLVDGIVLTGVFATVLVLVAGRLIFFSRGIHIADGLPSGPLRYTLSGLIGALSAMMGIGGGSLNVPVLHAYGYSIRKAVGTSAFVGLIIAVPGAIGFAFAGYGVPGLPPYSFGYVNLPALLLIISTTLAMAPVGAHVAHNIPHRILEVAFAVFMVAVAISMFSRLA